MLQQNFFLTDNAMLFGCRKFGEIKGLNKDRS